MTERRAASQAQAFLSVGSGDAVALNAAAGRAQLQAAFPRRKQERTLPGGTVVQLPMTIREGRTSFVALRTVAMDQLFCGANQQNGQLTLRPQGTAPGLPQRDVPVVIQTRLAITGGGLAVWSVTLTKSGDDKITQQS